MEITQRAIEVTAGILWNNAEELAVEYPNSAVRAFSQLAVKYSALSLLFCGRHDDTELLFNWLKEAARAMAAHYLNLDRGIA